MRTFVRKCQGYFDGLPSPFSTPEPLGVGRTLQMAIIEDSDTQITIVKHYRFVEAVRRGILEQKAKRGVQLLKLQQVLDKFRPRLTFQYMFERLERTRFLFHELRCAKPPKEAAAPKVDPLADPTAVEAGYAFIRKCAPPSNINLHQSVWIAASVREEGCPIFKWGEVRVEKACCQLAKQASSVTSHVFFPLTLADWRMDILDLFEEPFRARKRISIVIFGVPGVGKSPFSESLMMAISRASGDSDGPYYRSCSVIAGYSPRTRT